MCELLITTITVPKTRQSRTSRSPSSTVVYGVCRVSRWVKTIWITESSESARPCVIIIDTAPCGTQGFGYEIDVVPNAIKAMTLKILRDCVFTTNVRGFMTYNIASTIDTFVNCGNPFGEVSQATNIQERSRHFYYNSSLNYNLVGLAPFTVTRADGIRTPDTDANIPFGIARSLHMPGAATETLSKENR